MKLNQYQLFQSVHVLITALANFYYESLYLYLKRGHIVAVDMYSLITHQLKQRCPYKNAHRQEYWKRGDCFIATCKYVLLRNSYFQFLHLLVHTK